jgi:hypothetical protein
VGSKVPDYRGLFLRGHGSQVHVQLNGSKIGVTSTLHESGQLGQVQGDAGRNIAGNSGRVGMDTSGQSPDGVFSSVWTPATDGPNGGVPFYNSTFDASRVVPVADENRPVNTAVRYLIRALP